MTARTTSLNLDRRAYGLRFVAAETEGAYRSWCVEQNLSLLRVVCWVSIAA